MSAALRRVLKPEPGKRPGRPTLDWTPSQQRQLVRLVCDADVPFNDLEVALRSPGFAPRKGNIRQQWKTLTQMKPDQLRVRDPIKKDQRKAQAIRACEAYLKCHGHHESQPTGQLPQASQHITDIEALTNQFSSKPTNYAHYNFDAANSTPTVSALPPLSTIATPTESICSDSTLASSHDVPTGSRSDIYHTTIAIDHSTTPRNADSPALFITSDGSKKRPAPLEFEFAASNALRRARLTDSNQYTGLKMGGSPPKEKVATQQRNESPSNMVQEPTKHDSKISRGPAGPNSIADVEAKMKVPPGFIDFFKYGLTITRSSIASALSASGSVRSRWSRKLPRQPLPEIPQLPQQWPPANQPMTETNRPGTDLFWELQLGGIGDDEIAARLQNLIKLGADIHARSPSGETPLHVALRSGNLAACKCLLSNGADVYARTLDGKGFSEYGKIAYNNVRDDTKQYLAIKSCRNVIKEHDPRHKAPKATTKRKKSSKVPEDPHPLDTPEGGDQSWMTCLDEFGVQDFTKRPFQLAPEQQRSDDGICTSSSTQRSFQNLEDNMWNTIANLPVPSNSLESAQSLDATFLQNASTTATSSDLSIAGRTQTKPAPIVRDLVEFFEPGSTRLPVAQRPKIIQSEKWSPEETPATDFDAGVQPSTATTFSSLNTYSSNIKRLPAQSSFFHPPAAAPAVPIQPHLNSHSQVHNEAPHALSAVNLNAATRLTGYLEKLSTGQMALVCLLPDSTSENYAAQAPKVSSLAMVQIMPRPARPQPRTAANITTNAFGACMPQRTAAPSVPTWSDLRASMQHGPGPASVNFMPPLNDGMMMASSVEVNDEMPIMIDGSEYAFSNDYVPDWDYHRPGFNL